MDHNLHIYFILKAGIFERKIIFHIEIKQRIVRKNGAVIFKDANQAKNFFRKNKSKFTKQDVFTQSDLMSKQGRQKIRSVNMIKNEL